MGLPLRQIDHVVASARQAGHSWTEIGGKLGVSKQAAGSSDLPTIWTGAAKP
jgi:hypothetical protein